MNIDSYFFLQDGLSVFNHMSFENLIRFKFNKYLNGWYIIWVAYVYAMPSHLKFSRKSDIFFSKLLKSFHNFDFFLIRMKIFFAPLLFFMIFIRYFFVLMLYFLNIKAKILLLFIKKFQMEKKPEKKSLSFYFYFF